VQSTSKTLVTKVVSNIDALNPGNLKELKYISYFLNAVPLIIGRNNRRNELEESVAYYRQGITALSLKTLHNLLKNNESLLYFAKRGSIIAQINGNKIKSQREKMSMSRKDLSRKIDVSAKSIASYERGIMNTNKEHLKKIEEVLEIKIIEPVKLFDQTPVDLEWMNFNDSKPKPRKKNMPFFDEIYEIFEELEIFQFWTSKSPFDVLVSIPTEKHNKIMANNSLISAIFPYFDSKEEERLNIIRKILKIARFYGIVIVDEKIETSKSKIGGIPVIEKKELKSIKNQKDFKKLVRKKL
jgi:predicted transcriptional regulator